MIRTKTAILTLLMLTAAALAHIATPRLKLTDSDQSFLLEYMFPRSFAAWRVDENLPMILPSPEIQAKLDRIYNQVLARTYVNDHGDRIMLSVAYGGDQSDGTSAHKPEVCYPAQGFQILLNRRQTLDTDQGHIPVRQLVSRLGSRVEPITYWIVVGDRAVTSATEQKLAQIRFGLRGLIPDGMLIRVSSIDRDADHAFVVQQHFVRSMVAALGQPDRVRVAGLR